MTDSDSSEAKKVAVIAVHGVSDQKPFDSAKEVANLLINPETNQKRNYSLFKEKFIRFFVSPFSAQNTENHNVDFEFTQKQLSHYNQSSVYETICLEGELLDEDGKPKKTVHIYEMYWADLSRLSENFFRIFGELYQILFHFSVVGSQVAELAKKEHNKDFPGLSSCLLNSWVIFQKFSSTLLSLLIPIFNLYLLIIAFLAVPVSLIEKYANDYFETISMLVLIAIGLFFAFIAGNFLFKRPARNTFKWLFIQLAGGLVGTVIVYYLSKSMLSKQAFYNYLITLIWLFILIAFCQYILINGYEQNRPGAFNTFKITGILIISSLIILLIHQMEITEDNYQLLNNATKLTTYLSLNIIEIVYLLIYLFWGVFNITYFLSLISGACVLIKYKYFNLNRSNSISLLKLVRAFWTSLASLLLPATLFVFITLTLWSAVNSLGSSLIKGIDKYNPIIFSGLKQYIYLGGDVGNGLAKYCGDPQLTSGSDCFLQALSDFAGTTLMNYAFIAFIITLLIAIWALFPAILTDVFPPSTEKTQKYSNGLGDWLTNGFTTLIFGFFIGICLIIPIIGTLNHFFSYNYFFGIQYILGIDLSISKKIEPSPFLTISALLLTISAGSLIAFGSTLNKISLGLRGVLDAALDVDNYLRLDPIKDNPRARIYSRYVSLLKYLCHRSDNEKYDAIVIISHSQGTVISADLLRFLKEYENRLDSSSWLGTKISDIPDIYLFTMGSPIRQLYSFAFPHLYHWVYNPQSITKYNITASELHKDTNPDPAKLLKVKQWVNAYRSGDYIGRYLWRSPEDENLWKKVQFEEEFNELSTIISQDKKETRREFCIGAGGHTHYWDETAPDIAYELDRLIRDA